MAKTAVTVRQMQLLDRIAIERIGIPSIVLMENAGRSVACEVLKYLKRCPEAFVCILCGLGNNAGDGFVVARHLINAGIRIKVFIVGFAGKLKNDAFINYRILKRQKHLVKEIKRIEGAVSKDISRAGVVVDALFGVGLTRAIEDPFKSVIETVNRKAKRIVAVDVPSGLDGTTGRIYGVCIRAATTVTFGFMKKGLLKNDGPKYAGKIVVADIGIPKQLLKRVKR